MTFKQLVCSLAVLCLALTVFVAGAELMYPTDENEKCYHSRFSSGKPCRYPCSCNSATDRCEMDYGNVHKRGLLRSVSDQKDHEPSLVFALVHALDDRRVIYSEKGEGGRTALSTSEQTSLRYFLECSGKESTRAFLLDHEDKSTYDQVLPDENLFAYDNNNKVSCTTNRGTTIINNFRYKDIMYISDKEGLEEHVQKFGPTVVRIKAHPTMFLSTSIVENSFRARFKGKSELGDHYVEIVGLERDRYFVVKNSWGANWGEMGYWKVDITHFLNNYYLPGRFPEGKKRIPMVTMDINEIIKVEKASNIRPALLAVERREKAYARVGRQDFRAPSGNELHEFIEKSDEDHDIAKLKAALRIIKKSLPSEHEVVALHHADVTLAAGRKFYISVITERTVSRSSWLETHVYAATVWIPFPGYGRKHGFHRINAHKYEDAESDGGYLYYKIQPDEEVGKGGFGMIHKRNTNKVQTTTPTRERPSPPPPKEVIYYMFAGFVGVSMIVRAMVSRSLTKVAFQAVAAFVILTSAFEFPKVLGILEFRHHLYNGDAASALACLGHTVVGLLAPFTGPVNLLKNMLTVAPVVTSGSLLTFAIFIVAVWKDVDTRWELVTFLAQNDLIEQRVREEFANWDGFSLFPQKTTYSETAKKPSRKERLLGIKPDREENVPGAELSRRRIRDN